MLTFNIEYSNELFREEKARICAEIKLSLSEWTEFSLNLLKDYPWLEGRGGASSSYQPKEDIFESKEELEK